MARREGIVPRGERAIPLIVYDPDAAADRTRGSIDDRLVEAIDLAPTFVEAAGGTVPGHVLEGRSLLPALRGDEAPARDAVFSECDYSFRAARLELAIAPERARAYMVRTQRWKYVLYEGFRPQLFDLERDLANGATSAAIRNSKPSAASSPNACSPGPGTGAAVSPSRTPRSRSGPIPTSSAAFRSACGELPAPILRGRAANLVDDQGGV